MLNCCIVLIILCFFNGLQPFIINPYQSITTEAIDCQDARRKCEITCKGGRPNFSCNESSGLKSSCSCQFFFKSGSNFKPIKINNSSNVYLQLQNECDQSRKQCINKCNGSATFECSKNGNQIQKNCLCTFQNKNNTNLFFQFILSPSPSIETILSPLKKINVSQVENFGYNGMCQNAQNECIKNCNGSASFTCSNSNGILSKKCNCENIENFSVSPYFFVRGQNQFTPQINLGKNFTNQSQNYEIFSEEKVQNNFTSEDCQFVENLCMKKCNGVAKFECSKLYKVSSKCECLNKNLSPQEEIKIPLQNIDLSEKEIEVSFGALQNCNISCQWKMPQLPPKILNIHDNLEKLNITANQNLQQQLRNSYIDQENTTDKCNRAKLECSKKCGQKGVFFWCVPFVINVIEHCTCKQ